MGITKKKTTLSGQHQKHIRTHLLVIRLSAMGDVAMTVPVLRTLLQHHPELRVTMLSKPFFKPIFNTIPGLEFYQADIKGKHKGIIGLWRLARSLHALEIDAVADLHNVLRSTLLTFFFKWKGIPVIQIDKGRKAKKALTRKTDKMFKPLRSTIQRYADVFGKLGFPVVLTQHKFPSKKALPLKISKIISKEHEKWVGIAPYATYKSKTYPIHLMEIVIAKLNATNTCKILLFGGGDQEVKQLKSLSHQYKKVYNTAGIFSFEEELSIIAHLDLMVAMDSGNAHLAAMYGIPTITLWGVTHPYTGFYPFGQPADNALLADGKEYPLIPTSVYGNTYPKGYENAIQSITPQKLFEKIMIKIT